MHMTNREIFDKVKDHLLTQNRKSLNSSGDCAYRGLNGAMCAVGCLIPDDEYYPDLEGRSVLSLRLQNVPSINKLTTSNKTSVLLRRLQRIHDNIDPTSWEKALANLEEEKFNGAQT